MDKFSLKVKSHRVPGRNNDWVNGYYYEIYKNGVQHVEGNEYFDTEFRAKLAGLGHITLLEMKENES